LIALRADKTRSHTRKEAEPVAMGVAPAKAYRISQRPAPVA
jgi:hypothetical protein